MGRKRGHPPCDGEVSEGRSQRKMQESAARRMPNRVLDKGGIELIGGVPETVVTEGGTTTVTLLRDTPATPALAKLVFSSVLNATELDEPMEPKEVVMDAADAAEVAVTL